MLGRVAVARVGSCVALRAANVNRSGPVSRLTSASVSTLLLRTPSSAATLAWQRVMPAGASFKMMMCSAASAESTKQGDEPQAAAPPSEEEHSSNNNNNNNNNKGRRGGAGTEKKPRRPVDPEERKRVIEAGLSLYVSHLAPTVTWMRLKEFFEQVGDVKHARVATTPDQRSRGFGFVEFHDVETAQRAIEHLHGQVLDGNEITVSKQTVSQPKYGVFVSSIPWSVSSEELAEVFGGEVDGLVSSRIMQDIEGRSRGMAIVNFSSAEQRAACIEKMDGYELHGRSLRVRESQPPTRDNYSRDNSRDE